MRAFLVVLVVLVVAGCVAALARAPARPPPPAAAAGSAQPRPRHQPRLGARAPRADRRTIAWRRSVAVGQPWAGRLRRGVPLPPRGPGWRTWDPVLKRGPDRQWRRWGTDRLVRVLLRAIAAYRRAHPEAPPVLVGDLSRTHGGDFGRRFGSIGHMTHQNGRDADVYYPRRDRRQAAARSVAQVDLRLAQALVDAFVAAGAQIVLVGPHTGLSGPPGRVQPFPNHDDHLHVRIPPVP